ncbi:MAG TPA: helical backbone metal receptor [Burkholderiaceae bacterium]|jgi:iron complex transport system substrate-binding protein
MLRVALAVLLCWHGLAAAQAVEHDDRGAAISLPAPPRRIVSLLPSLTESVCALGACDRLVGTDRFSNWPASVAALPKLGGLDDAQIERIAALKPDLVLASTSARVIDRLEALGLKVVVLDSRSHDEVHRSLILLARLLATPIPAERVWAQIEHDTRAAAERVPPALRGRRVYFEIDATPYAAGAGSFVGETLQQLGMPNAVPAELGPFPKLNPEYVVRLQPDIIMSERRALDAMAERPGWAALKALKTHQTCGFPSTRYELLIRPGPRMGEAARVLADCLAEIARRR